MSTDVRLIVDGAELAYVLRSPQGPVARCVIERGTRVQRGAQVRCPVRTGRLKASIVKRPQIIGGEFCIAVVAAVDYAYFVHEGTEPHEIVPRKGKVLAFYWAGGPTGAHVYFFKRIHHPGTKPNRFLSESLYLAVA